MTRLIQCQVKEAEMSEAVPPPFSPRGTIQAYMYDSGLEAEKLFECMIHPVQTDKFFRLVDGKIDTS